MKKILSLFDDKRFGEVLGKHSDVQGEFGEQDIVEVSTTQSFLKELEEILGETISGYNPLNYIEKE